MDFNYILNNFHFVNLFWAFVLPIILMAIDFATGFVNACIKHTRSSSKMREGGGKKFAEFVCIAVAALFVCAMDIPVSLVYLVSAYIVIMELVSIAENVKKLGVPIPGKAEDKLDKIKNDLKPKDEREEE